MWINTHVTYKIFTNKYIEDSQMKHEDKCLGLICWEMQGIYRKIRFWKELQVKLYKWRWISCSRLGRPTINRRPSLGSIQEQVGLQDRSGLLDLALCFFPLENVMELTTILTGKLLGFKLIFSKKCPPKVQVPKNSFLSCKFRLQSHQQHAVIII